MWDSTPPVIETNNGAALASSCCSTTRNGAATGNDLHQLGVVEVGKHVGLFNDGPAPTRSAPSQHASTHATPAPHVTPPPAPVSPTSSTATISASENTSPRSQLCPNAAPANPFSPLGVSLSSSSASSSHPSRRDSAPPAQPSSLPAPSSSSSAAASHRPRSLSASGGDGPTSSHTAVVPPLAHALSLSSLGSSLTAQGTSALPPLPKPSNPFGRQSSATVAAGSSSVSPRYAQAAPLAASSSTTITPTHPTIRLATSQAAQADVPRAVAGGSPTTFRVPELRASTPTLPQSPSTLPTPAATPAVRVLPPTAALVGALPSDPPLGGAVGSLTTPPFARAHSTASSSAATTATEGTEWIQWRRPPADSPERPAMMPSSLNRRTAANAATTATPPTPTPTTPQPGASPAGSPPSSNTHRSFTTTLTHTNTATTTTTTTAPPSLSATMKGSMAHAPAVLQAGDRSSSNPFPQPEASDEPVGFYHGMSINNLERSFFFPAASSVHGGGSIHGAPSHPSPGGGVMDESARSHSSVPHTHSSFAHGSLTGAPAPLPQSSFTGASESMPLFNVSFAQPVPDEAMTAVANHEAALLAAMPTPAPEQCTQVPHREGSHPPCTVVPSSFAAGAGTAAAASTVTPLASPSSLRVGSSPLDGSGRTESGLCNPSTASGSPALATPGAAQPSQYSDLAASMSAYFQSPRQGLPSNLLAASVMSGSASLATNSFCSPTLASLDLPWGPGAATTAAAANAGSTPSTNTTAAAPNVLASASPSAPTSSTSRRTGSDTSSHFMSPLAPPPSSALATATGSAHDPPPSAAQEQQQQHQQQQQQAFAFQSEQVEPFRDCHRRYQALKESCTDAYLTVVEQAVDSFLTVHFNPDLKSAAAAAVGGGRWGRAGQRLLQVGSTLLRRAGANTSSHAHATGSATPPASASPPTPSSPRPTDASDPTHALRYTPDVIPAHYLDERPSDSALRCVALNYPVLLCALASFFPPEAGTPGTRDGPGTGTAPAHATSSTTTTTPPLFSLVHHAALRDGLTLPTIYTVWKDYLTPLQGKATEVLQIAEEHVQPALAKRLVELEAASNPTRPQALAEAAALRDAIAAVAHAARAVREDLTYIDTIRGMDTDYCDELEAERAVPPQKTGKPSTRSRFNTGELSQYVPVFGLLLSRLHRLEMEHRTVLELWGPSKSTAHVMNV